MKTVVYSCPYIPAEWIAAHGLKPRRIIPTAADAGSAFGRREGMCPFARSFLNEAVGRTDADAVIMTTMCDQMRRAFDILIVSTVCPAMLVNVPTTWRSPVARKMYVEELKRLSRFLVTIGGREPSRERLIEVMTEYQAAREQLLALRSSAPAGDFARLIESFGAEGPAVVAGAGERLGESRAGIRLAIVGGPLMKQDFDIYDIVESNAGRIVFDATETAERGLAEMFDPEMLSTEPVEALADAYFGGIRDASQRPNDHLHKWIGEQCRDRGVKGVIFHRHVWCDSWHGELGRIRESLELPVLDIEARSDGRSGEHRTPERILAFLEMLQ